LKALNLALSQTYAAEGQCYVLASSAVVSQEMFAVLCDMPDKAKLLNPRTGKPGGGFLFDDFRARGTVRAI
jgi:nitrilase